MATTTLARPETPLPDTPLAVVERADRQLGTELRTRLTEVEVALLAGAAADDDFVSKTATHLIRAGGKRIRPLLALLGAQFGNPRAAAVVPAAVVIELTHVASLYHDDVMDEALRRHGVASANARWDNRVAVLVGDYLLARAAEIGTVLPAEAIRDQAAIFSRLVRGQAAETLGPAEGQDPREHYLKVVADKSASLIMMGGKLGAQAAGAAPTAIRALVEYGEALGIAFQIADDLLDILSTSNQSGKTPGTDLREGIRTLPVLHALADDRPAGARLRALLSEGPLTDDARHEEALELLRHSPAVARTRRDMSEYAVRARAALTALPPVPARRALAAMVDFITHRTG